MGVLSYTRQIGSIFSLAVIMSSLGGAAATLAAPEPSSRATGYHLSIATLPGGKKTVIRFDPCQKITYKVNVSNLPMAEQAVASAEISGAVADVASATRMKFKNRGTTTSVTTGKEWFKKTPADLVISYATRGGTGTSSLLPAGAAGFGGYAYKTWSVGGKAKGSIGRAYVVLDSSMFSTLTPGSGPGISRGNVIRHELAHSVGLAHVEDPLELMFPDITGATPAGYQSGDLEGLHLVGRAAGCLKPPSSVWPKI